MFQILYMDYYAKFHCIGGDCPLTCCGGGWKIALEESEIESYKKLPEPFRNEVLEAIDTEEKQFKQENGYCKLLTNDGWCSLVRNCGEKSLSKTCTVFPRLSRIYGTVQETMVEIVCPEVAGYLLKPEIITFGIKEIEDLGGIGQCDEELYIILSDLRANLVELVQSDQGNNRGKVLAILKLQEYIEDLYRKKSRMDRRRIQRYWKSFAHPDHLDEIFALGGVMEGRTHQQVKILTDFLWHNYKEKTFHILYKNTRQFVDYDQIMSVWAQEPDVFERDLEEYLMMFRREYICFAENYFVYSLFRDWIPENLEMEAFGKNMVFRIVEFAMIQMLSMSLWKNKGTLDSMDYEIVIAAADRLYAHSKNIKDNMMEYVKGLSQLELLFLLIV